MPGISELKLGEFIEDDPLVVLVGREEGQAFFHILHGVQRLGRLVFGIAVAVGPFGFFFLYLAAILEDDPGQAFGRDGTMDLARKAVLDQERKIAAVVEVGVGQQYGFDGVRLDGKRSAVFQPEVFQALEQAAVYQDPLFAVFEERFGAGDSACGAQKSEGRFHEDHF